MWAPPGSVGSQEGLRSTATRRCESLNKTQMTDFWIAEASTTAGVRGCKWNFSKIGSIVNSHHEGADPNPLPIGSPPDNPRLAVDGGELPGPGTGVRHRTHRRGGIPRGDGGMHRGPARQPGTADRGPQEGSHRPRLLPPTLGSPTRRRSIRRSGRNAIWRMCRRRSRASTATSKRSASAATSCGASPSTPQRC